MDQTCQCFLMLLEHPQCWWPGILCNKEIGEFWIISTAQVLAGNLTKSFSVSLKTYHWGTRAKNAGAKMLQQAHLRARKILSSHFTPSTRSAAVCWDCHTGCPWAPLPLHTAWSCWHTASKGHAELSTTVLSWSRFEAGVHPNFQRKQAVCDNLLVGLHGIAMLHITQNR